MKKTLSAPKFILPNECCHCGSGLSYKHCHGKLISDNESIPVIDTIDDDALLYELLTVSDRLFVNIEEVLNTESVSDFFRVTVTMAMIDIALDM